MTDLWKVPSPSVIASTVNMQDIILKIEFIQDWSLSLHIKHIKHYTLNITIFQLFIFLFLFMYR